MLFIVPRSQCKKIFIILQLVVLAGCSGQEQAASARLRVQNAKGEYIYRFEGESVVGEISEPKCKAREPYPWENEEVALQKKS